MLKKKRVCFLMVAFLFASSLVAQQVVTDVPIETINPFDPTQPMQQMYCGLNQASNLLESWQPASNLYWNDPNRDTTPVCWVDCTGQIHCSTPCSSAFTSGCGGTGANVNWYHTSLTSL